MYNDQDRYKTAVALQRDFQLGDFRVEKITTVIEGGRFPIVETESGRYSFDNHAYVRFVRFQCIYRASSEAGIYDFNGEFLVVFERQEKPKKGMKVRAWNLFPNGRPSTWLTPCKTVEGYIGEIQNGLFLVDSNGKTLGWFSHFKAECSV